MNILFLTQYNGMILGPIAKILGFIIDWIFEFLTLFGIENTALCIILFTFIVKLLMIPFTIKQQKFSKMSSKMNPELTAIQAKYKGKKDEASMRNQQLEIQAIYQKYGVSPTSGCLPMLITLPIMFALYRVIYNIPAYVSGIKDLYIPIASGIIDLPGYATVMSEYANTLRPMGMESWGDITQTISQDHLIDILSVFKTSDWASLKEAFPSLAPVIAENSERIVSINSLPGGLNVANAPGLSFPGIIIPILAMVFQFISGKQMESQNQQDSSNPAASTMKAMNVMMPIMSGFFCITFSIGVGLYWIASSVFQILQQFFINKYMDRIDVEDLIAKNVEKVNKKKAKLGIDPNKSIEDLAKKQTKSIKDMASSTSVSQNSNNNKYKATDYNSMNTGKYKKGSLSEKAHLLDRQRYDKGDN